MAHRSRFGIRGHGHCLREGRKLRPPELLEVCAVPGGGVAAMMVGAAWFGFGDDLSESQRPDRRSILGPSAGLFESAIVADQAFRVPH